MKTYTVKISDTGTKYWYLNGERHREDGPAIEYADGSKLWFLKGERHRTDGPAIEYVNGTKEWYLNDKLHREDGPAVEHANGSKFWYLNDKLLTEAQWRKAVQPKSRCAGKIVEIDGKRYKLVEA
jgi:hypothetical protein